MTISSEYHAWCALSVRGFPDGAGGKESSCQCRRHRDAVLIPGLGRSPGKNMCFWDHVRYFAPGGCKTIRSGQETFTPKKSSIERE